MDSNYPKELVGIWTYKWGPTLRALQIGLVGPPIGVGPRPRSNPSNRLSSDSPKEVSTFATP